MAVAGLTTSIGVFLPANKKKRMNVFSELYEFNEQLLINMKFTRRTIDKVACDFKYVPEILEGNKILDGEDWEIISDYISGLGKSDALSQIDYLNERKNVLKKCMEESTTDYKQYSALYFKIFFLIGVLMAILLA